MPMYWQFGAVEKAKEKKKLWKVNQNNGLLN